MRLYGAEEMEGRAILRPVSSETLGTGERVGQFHPLPCSLREDNKVFSRHFWNNLWDKDGHWGHGPLGFLHIVGRGRGRRSGPHRV